VNVGRAGAAARNICTETICACDWDSEMIMLYPAARVAKFGTLIAISESLGGHRNNPGGDDQGNCGA
jgi:hypothetical protein